jgi:hypothetical protein
MGYIFDRSSNSFFFITLRLTLKAHPASCVTVIYQYLLSFEKCGRGLDAQYPLRLVLMLRTRGAVPPLPTFMEGT